MAFQYGGGGNLLDEWNSPNNPKKFKKLDLKYFINCSNQRLCLVKRGSGLMDTMKSQKESIEKLKKVKSQKSPKAPNINKKRYKASLESIRDIRKNHEHSSSIRDISDVYLETDSEKSFESKSSHLHTFSATNLNPQITPFFIENLKLSAELVEYFENPSFDKTLEQKKLENLVEYFQERYKLISRELKENEYRNMITKRIKKLVKKFFKKRPENNKKLTRFNTKRRGGVNTKGFQFIIQRKMTEIDDKIKKHIELLIAEEASKKEQMNRLPSFPSRSKSPKKKQVETSLRRYLDLECSIDRDVTQNVETEKSQIKKKLRIDSALAEARKQRIFKSLDARANGFSFNLEQGEWMPNLNKCNSTIGLKKMKKNTKNTLSQIIEIDKLRFQGK